MSRRDFTLADAGREFVRHPSPWMIGVTLAAAATARTIVGDWQVTDAVVPLVMVGVFPLAEWVIHVAILHWRPRRLGPVVVDTRLARDHRRHHAEPRDVPLIFIPWPSAASGRSGPDRAAETPRAQRPSRRAAATAASATG